MTEASIATKPVRNAAIARPAPNYRAIRIWLWSVAAVVFAMVILGGTTRLTDSGLSITEWNPISGVLPPLNHADWLAEFAKYKQIPQYKDLFSNMDLNRFKFIFMWEWSHRLLGRFMIGIVFIIPFAVFWLRDMLPTGMKAKLL
ncbi:MAG TPA: COX15/CtaA family protein, partial [Methylovirgula sp.]